MSTPAFPSGAAYMAVKNSKKTNTPNGTTKDTRTFPEKVNDKLNYLKKLIFGGTSYLPVDIDIKTTTPLVIDVTNNSDETVNDLDVFGAFLYLNNSNSVFTEGSLNSNEVLISSPLENVNYKEILFQSTVQPFHIGLMYISLLSGGNSQLTQVFKVITQDANGNVIIRPIVPLVDPYQQQPDIIAVTQKYWVDGFTKLCFRSIKPKTSIRLTFYLLPEEKSVYIPQNTFRAILEIFSLLWMVVGNSIKNIFKRKNKYANK